MKLSSKLVKVINLISLGLAIGLWLILLTCLIVQVNFLTYQRKLNELKLANLENLPSQNQAKIKILFFGDLMLDRQVREKIKKDGLNKLLANLAGEENVFFRGLDLVSANLEGAVTNQGAHYPPTIEHDFAFSPEDLAGLKKYNFNFFNLANNHLIDQGSRGIIETRENLANLGFNFSGCPDGQIGDCSTKIIQFGQLKLALVGLSMVYQQFDLRQAKQIVADLDGIIDFIIINIHWGDEYQHQFNKKQQVIAHQLIEAGADLVIGHHPHVVQGLEIYKNKLIFYSLGNFIFDQYFSAATQQGLAIAVSLINHNITTFLFPIKAKLSQVELIKDQEKENFFKDLISWSEVNDKDKAQLKQGKIILK